MNIEYIINGAVGGLVSGIFLLILSQYIKKRRSKKEKMESLNGKIIEWCNVNRSERLSGKANRFEATICPYRNNASKKVKKKIDKYCACLRRVGKEQEVGYEDNPERKRNNNYASLKSCEEAKKELCKLIDKELIETKTTIFNILRK